MPAVRDVAVSLAALLLASGGTGGSTGLALVSAAYFHVKQGQQKCFLETIPEHQFVTIKYRHVDNPGIPCMLLFKDPRGKGVFSKRVGENEREQGKTGFMTQRQGEHKVCIKCEGKSSWLQKAPLKWEFHVDLGDTDPSKLPASRDDFHGVSRTLQSTFSRAESIKAENEYEKSAEIEFRDVSERMNNHVVVVSIFIMVMEACLVGWQISHLRSFFRREKLI